MRRILIITHKYRDNAKELALKATHELNKYGIEVLHTKDLKQDTNIDIELILVLGGDGSILSAAHYARKYNVPLIGINLGHIGFLAEMNPEDINIVVKKIVDKDYIIEERSTLEVDIYKPDGTVETDWAINEAALIRTDSIHPAYVSVGVDNEPISSFGCDGIIFSTPTGSTAYSFSCGGPIVWPGVDALIMIPIAAHALFTRPMIVGKNSVMQLSVHSNQWADLAICCDGIRTKIIPENSQICAHTGAIPIKLARMTDTPFSARLVAKFNLQVEGWRKTGSNNKPNLQSKRK